MKFEIQLFKYLGVAVVGAAYFGVGIPMLISANIKRSFIVGKLT
jgi:hypothetical protein